LNSIISVSPPASPAADIILAVHFAWAAWMITGAVLAVLGFRWPRLWGWRVFRMAHLIGLLGTATTPFWSHGICPLTIWEGQLRSASSGQPAAAEPFIIHWMSKTLFINVDPLILSIFSGALALATLIIFASHPPWKYSPKKPSPPLNGP
jgi:hypothetical protein